MPKVTSKSVSKRYGFGSQSIYCSDHVQLLSLELRKKCLESVLRRHPTDADLLAEYRLLLLYMDSYVLNLQSYEKLPFELG